jgi:hypothetical protein
MLLQSLRATRRLQVNPEFAALGGKPLPGRCSDRDSAARTSVLPPNVDQWFLPPISKYGTGGTRNRARRHDPPGSPGAGKAIGRSTLRIRRLLSRSALLRGMLNAALTGNSRLDSRRRRENLRPHQGTASRSAFRRSRTASRICSTSSSVQASHAPLSRPSRRRASSCSSASRLLTSRTGSHLVMNPPVARVETSVSWRGIEPEAARADLLAASKPDHLPSQVLGLLAAAARIVPQLSVEPEAVDRPQPVGLLTEG